MASPTAPARYRNVDNFLPSAFRTFGAPIADEVFGLLISDAITEYPPGQLFGLTTAGVLTPCSIAAVDGSAQPVAVSLWAISNPNRVEAGEAIGSVQPVTLRTRGRWDVRLLADVNPNMGLTPEDRYRNILALGRAAGIFANFSIFSDERDALVEATVNPGYRVAVDYADAGVKYVYNPGDGETYPVVLPQADYNKLVALGVVS